MEACPAEHAHVLLAGRGRAAARSMAAVVLGPWETMKRITSMHLVQSGRADTVTAMAAAGADETKVSVPGLRVIFRLLC